MVVKTIFVIKHSFGSFEVDSISPVSETANDIRTARISTATRVPKMAGCFQPLIIQAPCTAKEAEVICRCRTTLLQRIRFLLSFSFRPHVQITCMASQAQCNQPDSTDFY